MRVAFATICLLLVGCDASKRACRKAEGMVAKATLLCPELLAERSRTDTITVVLPGISGEGTVSFDAVAMDSLPVILRPRDIPTHDAQADHPQQLQQLRSSLCTLRPVQVHDSLLDLRIWTENGAIRYTYAVHPRIALRTVTTTTPTIKPREEHTTGVHPMYRTAFWVVALLPIALLILLAIIRTRQY
jgi:hypothetical protein